jgi:phage repressor protein C with HTH and peptisase S24 domain
MPAPMAQEHKTDLQRRIEARLAELGKSPRKASLEVSDNADLFRSILRGKTLNPRSDSLDKIAEALGVTVAWLVGETDAASTPLASEPRPRRSEVRSANVSVPQRYEMPRDLPVYGTVAGSPLGNGAFQITPDAVDYLRRPPLLEGVRDAYALYVENDSMSPMYSHGDVVIVHPHKPPRLGDPVIIQEVREAGEIAGFIKLLAGRTADWIITRQLNPAAELRFRRDRVRDLHKVLTLNELLGV